MSRWEYWVEKLSTDYDPEAMEVPEEMMMTKELQSWGDDGWEAIAFLPAAPETNLKRPKNPWLFYVIFKRPKEE